MNLSYDELRRIYRLEKNTSKLVQVQEDFYNSLNEFMKGQKNQYLESLKEMDSAKAKDYTNLKKMVEEIFSMREKKLLNLALISSRTNEATSQPLALQEKDTFDSLLNALQRHQCLLLDIFSNNSAKPEKKKDLNLLPVKLTEDVKSFVGSDMKEYGPFKKGEAVKLPYKVAKVLISRELASAEK